MESVHPTDKHFFEEQSAAARTALYVGKTLFTRFGEVEASAEPTPVRRASHPGVGYTHTRHPGYDTNLRMGWVQRRELPA